MNISRPYFRSATQLATTARREEYSHSRQTSSANATAGLVFEPFPGRHRSKRPTPTLGDPRTKSHFSCSLWTTSPIQCRMPTDHLQNKPCLRPPTPFKTGPPNCRVKPSQMSAVQPHLQEGRSAETDFRVVPRFAPDAQPNTTTKTSAQHARRKHRVK